MAFVEVFRLNPLLKCVQIHRNNLTIPKYECLYRYVIEIQQVLLKDTSLYCSLRYKYRHIDIKSRPEIYFLKIGKNRFVSDSTSAFLAGTTHYNGLLR